MPNYFIRLRNIFASLLVNKTMGARALVIQDSKILLIKHSYVSGWYTIGGAVDKGETPVEAVQRELLEEAGIECLTLPRLFSVYHNKRGTNDDFVVLYIVNHFVKKKVKSIEVVDEKWFDMDQLPLDISPATKRRIEEYQGIRSINERW